MTIASTVWTLALTLPYPCDTSMFKRCRPLPWVTRRSRLTKEAARKKLGLPGLATVVLLSFGGLGLTRLPWARLSRQKEFFFVSTGALEPAGENLRFFSDRQSEYEDLVRACDAIVSKPGYGIVADVLSLSRELREN